MEIDYDLQTQSVTFYKVRVTEEVKPYLEALSETIDEVSDIDELFSRYNFDVQDGDNTARGDIGNQGFEIDLDGVEWFSFVETNHDFRTSFMHQFRDQLEEDGFNLVVYFQENDYRCERFYTNDFFHKYFTLWTFVDGHEIYGIDDYAKSIFQDHGATDEEIEATDWNSVEDVERLAEKYDVDFDCFAYEFEYL